MQSIIFAAIALFAAQDLETKNPFTQLAADADVVAVVRVEETDYEYVRGFPRAGNALLRVLVAYKGTNQGDLLEVPEEGLEDSACYYPRLGITQVEGRRFLAFLNKLGESSYQGTSPTCRLPVLVTADSGYALLYPVDDIELERETAGVERLTYADPAAFVDASDYTASELAVLTEDFQAEKIERDAWMPETQTYVYTLGIPISTVRQMMRDGLRASTRSPADQ